LIRVDPKEITKDFANILKDEVIGTKVQIKIKLHKGFRFRHEQPETLLEGGSQCTKEIGNVTAKSDVAFEYENKNDVELKQLGVDLDAIKEIPFQAVISYISTEGHQLIRVITKKQKATHDQSQAEQHAKIDVLAGRAVQKQAELASKGDYLKSEALNKRWGNYMEQNVLSNQRGIQASEDAYRNFSSRNEQIGKAVTNTRFRKEMPSNNSKQGSPMYPQSNSQMQEQESVKSSGGFLGKLGSLFSKKQSNDSYSAPMQSNSSRAQATNSLEKAMPMPSSMNVQPNNNNNNVNDYSFGMPAPQMSNNMQQQMQSNSLFGNQNQSMPMSMSFGEGVQQQKQEAKMDMEEANFAEEEDQDAEIIFRVKNKR